MLIKPITVQLLAYGLKANLAAIRKRAIDLLEDEHGRADPACFVEMPAAEVQAAIDSRRLDTEVVLLKPTPSHQGLALTLPEVNERATTAWLHELPVARTCVALAAWDSPREQLAWQMLLAEGRRWSESRALA